MGKLRVVARRSALGLGAGLSLSLPPLSLSTGVLPVAMLSVLLVSACTPVYRDHGYAPTDADLQRVELGFTRDQVIETIGHPGVTGVLTDSAWYYVGSRWRHYGLRAPEPVSREVLAISFSPAGKVSNIERFGLEDGRVVVLSRRVTATGVTGVSFITQLLRSVGNMQADQFLRPDD